MPNENAIAETSIGYLSMLEFADHGYFGGYLLISLFGRPLEFHCTAPVRPSRAQRILYGPTLEPYLLGEQIAAALLGAAKISPSLILTDREATLHIRTRSQVPIVLLSQNGGPSTEALRQIQDSQPTDKASTQLDCHATLSAGSHRTFGVSVYDFQLPLGFEADRDEAVRLLNELSRQVDLAEPFHRIYEAIREAQRLGDRDAETHDQAA
ncbi:MAG TPA: hypothetical protein VHE81_16440 [Lacipirellulaceae bacterium]|nr:hypothetical protein [Lacipirellulaceae bacterium]